MCHFPHYHQNFFPLLLLIRKNEIKKDWEQSNSFCLTSAKEKSAITLTLRISFQIWAVFLIIVKTFFSIFFHVRRNEITIKVNSPAYFVSLLQIKMDNQVNALKKFSGKSHFFIIVKAFWHKLFQFT